MRLKWWRRWVGRCIRPHPVNVSKGFGLDVLLQKRAFYGWGIITNVGRWPTCPFKAAWAINWIQLSIIQGSRYRSFRKVNVWELWGRDVVKSRCRGSDYQFQWIISRCIAGFLVSSLASLLQGNSHAFPKQFKFQHGHVKNSSEGRPTLLWIHTGWWTIQAQWKERIMPRYCLF